MIQPAGNRLFVLKPCLLLACLFSIATISCDSKITAITPPPGGGGVTPPNQPPVASGHSSIYGQIMLPGMAATKQPAAIASEYSQMIASTDSLTASADHKVGSIIVKFRDRNDFQKIAIPQLEDKKTANCVKCVASLSHRYQLIQNNNEPRAAYEDRYEKTLMNLRQQYEGQPVDIFPNYIRTIQAEPTDALFAHQWHYPAAKITKAWDRMADGNADETDQPVVIAVIDTGVKKDHPDFPADLFVDEYDFISDPTRENDGPNQRGRDDNADDPGDSRTSNPSSYHGTHVIGTIAAMLGIRADYSGNDDRMVHGGVVGIARRVKIMPLRVLGVGGGEDSDIADAIRYAAKLPNASGKLPSRAADGINMSIGGPGYSPLIHDALMAAEKAGLFLTAAAGNSATSEPSYPAADESVIGIGALALKPGASLDMHQDFGKLMVRAFYSNLGVNLDLMAPGGETVTERARGVYSTLWRLEDDPITGTIYQTPDYEYYQGTSMACPHVQGVYALMKDRFPALTARGAVSIFKQTAIKPKDFVDDPKKANPMNYGFGMMDADAALALTQSRAEEAKLRVIALHVLMLDSSGRQIVAQTMTQTHDNYTFSFAGLTKGAYTLFAGTDEDHDGTICEARDLCGASATALQLDERQRLEAIHLAVEVMNDNNRALKLPAT